MGRQLLLIFFGPARSNAADAAVESKPVVTTPLVLLAILSLLGGGLNLPGVYSLEHWLEHTLENVPPGEFSIVTAAISLAVALLGLFLAYLVYGRKFSAKPQNDPLSGNALYAMLENKWKIDELYNAIIIRPYRGLAEFLSSPVDLGVVNNISAGLAWLMQATAEVLRRVQTGYVRSYALVVFIGVVLILAFILVK
jgi:NADH-quinone oxidoreductase subunit L